MAENEEQVFRYSSRPFVTGRLPNNTPDLLQFAGVPIRRPNLGPARTTLVSSLFVLSIPAMLSFFPKRQEEILYGVGLAALIAAGVAQRKEKQPNVSSKTFEKERDAEAIPNPRDGDRYVGVAYCEGAWAYRGDTSWDRGWLGVHNEMLSLLATVLYLGCL